MLTLTEAISRRDNNLDLLRLIAAFAVLVSHAWPIALGPQANEPLIIATGLTLGMWAVIVFFGLSGFLITGSYQRNPDPAHFFARRARRLLPGLIVCLLVSVFGVGALVTSSTLGEYFADFRTWRFLVVNASLLGFQSDLPGVFAANPYPSVAGSIWTLPYEAMCYAAVLGMGLTGVLARRGTGTVALIATILLAMWAIKIGETLPTRALRLAELGMPFAIGGLFWIWRDRVVLHPVVLVGLISIAILLHGTFVQPVIFGGVIVYGTLLLGFGRWFLRVRLPGDYSYGVYIYAFPVQGLMVHVFDSQTPIQNIALSLPITLGLAILSWHYVEKPWLRSAAGTVALRSAKAT